MRGNLRPLLFLLAILPTAAGAQAPLLGGFGGAAGYGSDSLAGNDDGSTGALDLTVAFPGGLRFYGGPYNQFWVNNNGNITFSGPVFNFTPMRFPIAARPMIAPYWADVDTRASSLSGENLVYWHLEPGRLYVTWYNVGYYGVHNDLLMSFQMIITNTLDCGSGDFDVEFRYNRCEWTTGDASGGSHGFGGTPAQAGFDAGNLTDFVELPGSFTMDILNLCTTSNIGLPGVWQFSVRSGGVVCPDSGMPCTVPDAMGPCAIGRTQCVGRGIECQPLGSAMAERCDGIDNNCDGTADEGDAICDRFEVCQQGVCVPPCFEGGCDTGYTCDKVGRCIEDECIGVTCEADERCEGGECLAPCEGIVCPHGEECIGGRCIDACDVVSCDDNQVCEDGVCVPLCPCRPCPSGRTCLADGSCAPRDCDIVHCPAGYYCDGGRCFDGCAGVVCPSDQRCELGACIDPPPPMPDAGPPSEDSGTIGEDAGNTPTDDAQVQGDAGTMMMAFDGGVDGGPPRGPPPRGGCGCRTTSDSHSELSWLFVIGAVLVWRRRRRG